MSLGCLSDRSCSPAALGRTILDRQRNAGWGAKIIDRLSVDLREAYPDMQGFSPRNIKYMRAFAAAWPDATIVQRVAAQLPWPKDLESSLPTIAQIEAELGEDADG